ncbi:unnamed protein product, partial [Urochloa humidicola]
APPAGRWEMAVGPAPGRGMTSATSSREEEWELAVFVEVAAAAEAGEDTSGRIREGRGGRRRRRRRGAAGAEPGGGGGGGGHLRPD